MPTSKKAVALIFSKLKGLYTQDSIVHQNRSLVTATVRFKLAEGIYWERLIDRPDRFDRHEGQLHWKWSGSCLDSA
jgi:hypothetical protein